jgi:CheY-like chemotaxis protein
MDRLLIVDDNSELLQLYKMMITITGHYHISGIATGGKEAVSRYRSMIKKPDLVLMDVNMPDMDGISAAKAIHRMDKNARILFVTSEDINNKDLPPELSDAGILRKPFSKEEFFSHISKALGARPLEKPLKP